MPDTFVQIARIEKTILSAPNGTSGKACEKLFTNKKTFEQIDKDKYRIAEQMSIFDYL